MTLQQLIIKKIDQFSGRDSLINKLEFYSKISNNQDQLMFDMLIININQVYDSQIDVEYLTIRHFELTVMAVNKLNESSLKFNCPILKFIADLIESNVKYVTGVRKLA